MAKKKPTKKRESDLNIRAFNIVQQATEDPSLSNPNNKNPHAVALGRLGGLKGGPARAKKLTKKHRSEIARTAAKARWTKKE